MNRIAARCAIGSAFLLSSLCLAQTQGEVATDVGASTEPEDVVTQPCCTAPIVPKGFFEVEAGYAGAASSSGAAHSSYLLLKYSVTDWFQVQVQTNNLIVGGTGMDTHAVDGVMSTVKFVLNEQQEWLPQFAVSLTGTFPTQAPDSAVQRTIDTTAWFYAAKDFGDLHFDLLLGATLFDLGDTPTPQGAASLMLSYNLGHGFGVSSGAYSSFGNSDDTGVDGGWASSLSYSPINQLAFSLGGDVGFFEARAFTVSVGVAFVPNAGRPLFAVKPPVARVDGLVASR